MSKRLKVHLIEDDDYPDRYKGGVAGFAAFGDAMHKITYAVCGVIAKKQLLTDVPAQVTCGRCRRYRP